MRACTFPRDQARRRGRRAPPRPASPHLAPAGEGSDRSPGRQRRCPAHTRDAAAAGGGHGGNGCRRRRTRARHTLRASAEQSREGALAPSRHRWTADGAFLPRPSFFCRIGTSEQSLDLASETPRHRFKGRVRLVITVENKRRGGRGGKLHQGQRALKTGTASILTL